MEKSHLWFDDQDNIYQVLMSEVRRYGRDFDSRQLTKTLTLKFERLQSNMIIAVVGV